MVSWVREIQFYAEPDINVSLAPEMKIYTKARFSMKCSWLWRLIDCYKSKISISIFQFQCQITLTPRTSSPSHFLRERERELWQMEASSWRFLLRRERSVEQWVTSNTSIREVLELPRHGLILPQRKQFSNKSPMIGDWIKMSSYGPDLALESVSTLDF